ncbi:MAG: YceI family protein [Ahrensia sp.]|nr:YceI family protein [Ahrensia sp.]
MACDKQWLTTKPQSLVRSAVFLVAMFGAWLVAGSGQAGDQAAWTSVPEQSRIAFGSIKSNSIGEVHHFNSVSGTVAQDGTVTITIDLTSAETNVDIRNERMAEHVFAGGEATVSGRVELAAFSDLPVGEVIEVETEMTLSFAGTETDFDARLLVARLRENRVMVSTADFIFLSTEDLGIDAGIDRLMQLAGLPGITRVSPMSIRIVFAKSQ